MQEVSASRPVRRLLPCYALRVKARHEKSVARALDVQGYEPFLPLYERRDRSGPANFRPVRIRCLPLFPTYVFCRFDPQRFLPVLQTPGVLNVVSFARTPIPLDESELVAVQRIVDSRFLVGPHESLLNGSYVQIRKGPLRGLTGVLERVKDRCCLVVGLSLLHRAVSVEVKPDWVVPSTPPNQGFFLDSA